MTSLEEIRTKVLKKVIPSKNEQERIQKLSRRLIEKVEKAAKEKGLETNVRLEGSVAKNTWLKDCPEIDVFMQVPTTTPRETFGTIWLEIAKKATEGYKQIKRFAEHPYLEAVVDEVWVNIVPCYKVKRGEWISATDRTPFHTDYIKEHLNKQLEKETRLLKRFMKGIDIYGAEIKIGGFSGYLCELLILNYRSFAEALRSIENWKEKVVIDYEKHYEKNEYAEKNFEEPLIVVDPVDKERNVAAAVRKEKLNEFIAASRAFLKNPDMNYFYPSETKALNSKQIIDKISDRGSTIVFVKFNGTAVPDVLWGQLYKSQKALQNIIKKHEFKILRDTVWSNEKNLNIFVFELENRFLPNIKRHLGPPIHNKVGCNKFLQKYIGKDSMISGPRIEDGRWVVDIQRNFRDIVKLLKEKLRDGGIRYGVAKIVSKAFTDSLEVLVNDEVLKLYSTYPDFAKFLTEYIEGKPRWFV